MVFNELVVVVEGSAASFALERLQILVQVLVALEFVLLGVADAADGARVRLDHFAANVPDEIGLRVELLRANRAAVGHRGAATDAGDARAAHWRAGLGVDRRVRVEWRRGVGVLLLALLQETVARELRHPRDRVPVDGVQVFRRLAERAAVRGHVRSVRDRRGVDVWVLAGLVRRRWDERVAGPTLRRQEDRVVLAGVRVARRRTVEPVAWQLRRRQPRELVVAVLLQQQRPGKRLRHFRLPNSTAENHL